MNLRKFERAIRKAEKEMADRISSDIYSDPNSFVGPVKPIKTWEDYANDPDYYLDLGFPHCWMPKMGTKAWRDAGGK